MEKAARFFEAALQGAEGGKARAYLRERGLRRRLQKRFRIGYAPATRNALKEHLATAGIAQEQMIEAGLLIAGDDIPVSFDRFRDRIIFPIARFPRPRHRLRRARARRRRAGQIPELAGDAALPQEPCPLQRPGRPRRLRKGGHVIAVEGYIDVIACVAAGFEATVAPLGTALTEDQLRLLWQMADEPILCFDGDEAGLKAAFRAVDLALPL